MRPGPYDLGALLRRPLCGSPGPYGLGSPRTHRGLDGGGGTRQSPIANYNKYLILKTTYINYKGINIHKECIE